jgi:hypothetical protein
MNMGASFNLISKLNWLLHTGYFLKKHFTTILALGLIAAFGRVIQLGGFGPIAVWTNIVLEVVVESTRILLFLYVLGWASIKSGALRIKRILTQKANRKLHFTIAMQRLKGQWFSITLNLIGFFAIAMMLNYLIELLAYETCLYINLKQDGILADASSEWTILLFFKNLSVIPITLVFEAVFLLWITNKFHTQKHSQL